MNNQSSILRKESFGGTLMNTTSGKRIYIDQEEYRIVRELGHIPDNLCTELEIGSGTVFIKEPSFIPSYNFSAPDTVFFEITRACNLSCEHCLNNSGKCLPEELSHKQRKSIVADLCFVGVQEIRFTGGEPTIVRELSDYVGLARASGLRVSIGTNAALINSVLAHKLASAGVNAAITSIDGLERQHDLIRGSGSFKKTLAGIDFLLAAKIPVRVNMVVMKKNMEEIPAMCEYFFQKNIPVMIRRLIPSGRAGEMQTEMLTEEDYAQLRDKLQSFLSDPRGLVRGHYLKNDRVVSRIKLPFERHDCSAGHRGLVVLPDGRVQTCGFLDSLGELSIGNLKDESLAFLWQRLIGSDYIQSLRSLLPRYNTCSCGPKTNCLAICLANKNKLEGGLG